MLASGSEVSLVLEAKEILKKNNIDVRVVSMMSWELFLAQSEQYREQILPEKIKKRLAVEAALPMGWEKFTGSEGTSLGVNYFGASAPGEILMEKYGLNVNQVVNAALLLLGRQLK
jgi:transketolase